MAIKASDIPVEFITGSGHKATELEVLDLEFGRGKSVLTLTIIENE